MKYIRGFLMAWGMFCWIPCPYRGWREEDRRAQIGTLPMVGLFIGGILCVIWHFISMLPSLGYIMGGTLLTGAYFLMTGFIHLDGFMDCSDAIMPRHPSMEERRRILKDSHSGAFAVICLVLMLMIFGASVSELYMADEKVLFPVILCILTCSRAVSAVSVLACRPMSTSQYSETGAKATDCILPIVITVITLCACVFASGLREGAGYVIAVSLITVAASGITGAYDRKKLGGMNGDISGHMITMSEMTGIAAAAVLIL